VARSPPFPCGPGVGSLRCSPTLFGHAHCMHLPWVAPPLSGQDTHRRPGERAALLPLLAATHQVVHLLHQAWFVEFLPHPGARLATPAFMTWPFSR